MSNQGKGKGKASDKPIRNPIIHLQPDQDINLSSVVHPNIFCAGPQCSGHQISVHGTRYACSECVKSFCDTCVRDENANHDVSHQMFACPTPCTIVETTTSQMPGDSDGWYGDELDLIDSSPSYFTSGTAEQSHSGDDDILRRFMPENFRPSVPQTVPSRDPELRARVERGEIQEYKYDGALWNRRLEPSPLEATTVRLLHLQPGEMNDKLQCSFFLVQLNDEPKPKYEVLSCSWHKQVQKLRRTRHAASNAGQAEDDGVDRLYALYVNENHFLEVSFEVYEALKAMRHPSESRALWNEELCVDRKDPNEKWHSIRSTPMIHQFATQMIVWADSEQDSTDMAMVLGEEILGKIEQLGGLSVAVAQNDEDIAPGSEAWCDAWRLLFTIFPKRILERRGDFRNVIFAREAVFQVGQYDRSWENAIRIAKTLSQADWVAAYYNQ